MANTINDLYLKYTNKVGRTLESDRYFQYLYEMVQAGENTFRQKNQILHKVVDERWLSTIEESLDAINTVIDNPRRFVTTTEEVVPVALAKKITAEFADTKSDRKLVEAVSMDRYVQYDELSDTHKSEIFKEIEREKKLHEQYINEVKCR